MAWAVRAVLAAAEQARPEADDAQRDATPARGSLAWAVWAILAVAAPGLAYGNYAGWFGSVLYGLEGFLLSRDVTLLGVGFVVGLWASRYQPAIGVHSRSFYAALLGGREKSAWALQTAVALLALAVFVVVVDPGLLDHLESVKAGDIEAKFYSVSTTTRDARVSLNPLGNKIEINHWIGFIEGFQSRNTAIFLFDGSAVKVQRIRIRNLLFENYFEPLAIFLACLDRHDLLAVETHRPSFVALALSMRNAFTQEEHSAFLDATRLSSLLEAISSEIANIDDIIQEEIPEPQQEECESFNSQTDRSVTITSVRHRIYGDGARVAGRNRPTQADGLVKITPVRDRIYGEGSRGLAGRNKPAQDMEQLAERLQQYANNDAASLGQCIGPATTSLAGAENEKKFKLSFIDPYVADFVGNMVSLALGHSEESNFLTIVKGKYPKDITLFHPGLVNLYYQLAAVKNYVEAPWPLDEKIQDLNHAMASVDYVITETRAKEREGKVSDEKPAVSPSEPCGEWPTKQAKIDVSSEGYDEILKTYFYVKLLVVSRFLETYFIASLAGDSLGEHDKLYWADLYRQLESILKGNGDAVKLDAISAPDGQIAAADLPYWRTALSQMDGSDQFDANLAMALSSVMLTESDTHHAPTEACAIARHYLSRAKDSIEQLSNENNLDPAEQDHLQGFTQQVNARIGISCQ